MSEEPRKRLKAEEEDSLGLLQHQNTCLAARLADKRSQLLRLQGECDKANAAHAEVREQLSKVSSCWSTLVSELDVVLRAAGCGSSEF
jgi:hypothetical protein